MNASPYKQISGNLIAASAGTGKTYQLTSRFVALLALGARPEKMIALTFTKKAAGEFRNRIFQALSDGALGKPDHDFPERNGMAARVWETWTGLHLNADMTLSESANPVALYPAATPMLKRAVEQGCFPEQLTPMAGEPPLPQLTTNFFAELLMRVLSKSSDLQLSTLDSFFNRVVAADLHRAGLSSVTPMNALQQQRATRTALLAMLAESEKSSHHESALITLLSSIAEDKGGALLDLLENNVNTYLSLYKEFPEKAPWGNPIPFGLPDCSDAGLISDEEVEGIQREINELVESISWKKPRSYVRKTLTTAAAKIRKGEFKASDSFKAWLNEDEQYLAPDAEQERDGELRGLINYLNKTCAGIFLRSVQERSVAMHELLGKYYTAYRESILREGLCTFDDIKQGARQLLGHNAADEDAGMALNLTTKLDHWMLDEFQDTDPVQWEILSNLLKENAQYPDKSLFVVGDKKQSIYSFRGASAELFEQLRGTVPTRDGYDWQKHGLTNSSLKESRRSVPEIMKFTNLVFEGISEVDKEFSQHSSHAGNSAKKGYVRVSVLPRNKAEQTLQNACRAIGNILEELTEARGQGMRRLKNDISVAILLRKGDAARSLVSWLRRYKPGHGNQPLLFRIQPYPSPLSAQQKMLRPR
ncbi:MAG: UvrD-helicase domain-containing protein [Akkermansia sp.]|nr:UvrD-helicase domain-containing protein [Akkermansia sp.]